MDDIEADNRRHKEEQRKLREKRKAHRSGAKSESQRRKEQIRREHQKRTLEKLNQKQKRSSDPAGDDAGGASAFKALFSKRAEGFMVDLNFRNACPRPPVGPFFVGRGVEGEIERLSQYRDNDVEKLYVFKLHHEADLGIPLETYAMDPQNYKNPQKKYGDVDDVVSDDDEPATVTPPRALHPDDERILEWTGPLGDAAAENLRLSRDRKRAAARSLVVSYGTTDDAAATTPHKKSTAGGGRRPLSSSSQSTPGSATVGGSGGRIIKRARRNDATSRVLDESTQSWMKKTTYIANNPYESVNRFKSLATTQKQTAAEVDRELKKSRMKVTDPATIRKLFAMAQRQEHPTIKRKHPTKKDVTAVWDLPLLPDVNGWGHTYAHVVIDQMPKAGTTGGATPSGERLGRAFVTDVRSVEETSRNSCNLIVPNVEKARLYDVAQKYDLDVMPLRDNENPDVNYLLVVDEAKGQVTYLPMSSRIQLSSGRPGRGVGTMIERRDLSEDDIKEIEAKTAEVDVDMAEKLRDK